MFVLTSLIQLFDYSRRLGIIRAKTPLGRYESPALTAELRAR